jgi:hypothetical protein
MKTRFIPATPLSSIAQVPALIVPEEVIPEPAHLITDINSEREAVADSVAVAEAVESRAGVEAADGESPDYQVAEEAAAVSAPNEEISNPERAAVEDGLSFRDSPTAPTVTAGAVYETALEWMARNGLPYNKTVVLRGYPHMAASWPCTLGTAMLYAAYLAGEARPFEILIPETQEPLLVGGDSAGQLYGVTQVASELTRQYETLRTVFLLYQAKFPTKMTLGPDAPDGSIAEVFILQLSGMLEAAHERTKRAEGALNVMDLLGVTVAIALKRIFGGLVPLDRLGALLQDTERMDWLQQHADELLATPSRYRD